MKKYPLRTVPLWVFDAMSVFADVSIVELFYICLGVIQTLGEGTLVQMSLLVYKGEVGELVQPDGKWVTALQVTVLRVALWN